MFKFLHEQADEHVIKPQWASLSFIKLIKLLDLLRILLYYLVRKKQFSNCKLLAWNVDMLYLRHLG